MWPSAQIRAYDAEDIFDLPSYCGWINESPVEILKLSPIQEAEELQPECGARID